MYISHFLYPFIHQRTLRLFPYLGYLNNAAVNMGVQVFFGKLILLFPLAKYPAVEFLDHMVLLFLLFEEPPYSFP